MKLRALGSSLNRLPQGLHQAQTLSDKRMAGWALQQRRWRMWSKTPCCAICGRLTDWPNGFELDHKVRLDAGGPDTEQNCQVLCTYYDQQGKKQGCHASKTALGQ